MALDRGVVELAFGLAAMAVRFEHCHADLLDLFAASHREAAVMGLHRAVALAISISDSCQPPPAKYHTATQLGHVAMAWGRLVRLGRLEAGCLHARGRRPSYHGVASWLEAHYPLSERLDFEGVMHAVQVASRAVEASTVDVTKLPLTFDGLREFMSSSRYEKHAFNLCGRSR